MKKIMILGASILQVPAIVKAKEMGLLPIVADMNPKATGFNESCGDIFHRTNWKKQGKVWICSKRNGSCKVKKIREDEIIEASKSFLGEDYGGKVVEYIDKIYIKDDSVTFTFKDGTVKIWQRK